MISLTNRDMPRA